MSDSQWYSLDLYFSDNEKYIPVFYVKTIRILIISFIVSVAKIHEPLLWKTQKYSMFGDDVEQTKV